MTRPDNTRYLRVAAQARHDQADQRTRDAIRSLHQRRQPITYTAVAAAAHVSRTWLYRQPELRALIADHQQPRPGAIPATQRATTESTTARLDALRVEIEHLRAENAILRDHVARALGQRRAQPAGRQPHIALAERDQPHLDDDAITRLHRVTKRSPRAPNTAAANQPAADLTRD
jgi:Family of unknown function (DUF6262)